MGLRSVALVLGMYAPGFLVGRSRMPFARGSSLLETHGGSMPDPVPEIELWKPEALSLPNGEFITNVPHHVFLSEATDTATFHKNYWKSPAENLSIPGLETAVLKGAAGPKALLGPTTGDDILSLLRAVHELRTRFQTAMGLASPGPAPRGRYVLAEIQRVLVYRFDDGLPEDADAHLAKIDADHAGDPESHAALALSLEDYARFAKLHSDSLEGLGGFSLAMLDEALVLAAALRALPPSPKALSPEAQAALDLRNRFLTLLSLRVGAIRTAARFVYRNHPEIARLATSVYVRRRKAAERASAKEKALAEPSASPEETAEAE